MKNFIILMTALMALALSSCVTVKPPQFESTVHYLDYYKIGHNGKILLSESNSYSGEYESIGSIIVDQKSGYLKIEVEKKTKKAEPKDFDEIYGSKQEHKSETKYKTGEYKLATFTTALEEAVDVAESMGGNAIINLKFENLGVDGIYVTGMVIKRK